jgi:two-component system nitrate/nitrite response regulator NarL
MPAPDLAVWPGDVDGGRARPNLERTLDAPVSGPEVAVVVADDPLVRSALLSLLSSQRVSAEGTAPEDVRDVAADVLVWDLGSDVRTAQERIEEVDDAEADIVALLPTGAVAAPALAAGARGLLTRETSATALAAAVRAVRAGLIVGDPSLASALIPTRDQTPLAEELTAREQEVLQHLSQGLSNKEIAAKMHISDHTVKFHVNAILTKLGVTSRTEAVVQAARRGLVIL